MPESIFSPAKGVIVELGDVPDAAFAQGILGPGFAIEPLTGVIAAPVDGEVLSVAPTGHAITLKSSGGMEILVHFGVDTVALNGRGIEICMEPGEAVAAGETLLKFDYDLVAAEVKSLCTPVIITNAEQFEISSSGLKGLCAKGDVIFSVQKIAGDVDASPDRLTDAKGQSLELVVSHEHGLHARPASLVAKAARANAGRIEIRKGAQSSDAKSLTGILALGLKQGDRISVWTDIRPADQVLMDVAELIGPAARETVSKPPIPSAPTQISSGQEIQSGQNIQGVGLGAGFAAGTVLVHKASKIDVPQNGSSPDEERAKLTRALQHALDVLLAEIAASEDDDQKDLLGAYAELLRDPALQELAIGELAGTRFEANISAGLAWQGAIQVQSEALMATGNSYLIARQADLTEVETRVLMALYGGEQAPSDEDLSGRIVVATDISPSEFFAYQRQGVWGIALARGGISSHVSILCQSAGLCSVIALGDDILALADGRPVAISAKQGVLHVEPEASLLAQLRADQDSLSAALAQAESAFGTPTIMSDGTQVAVYVNIASQDEAAQAGAKGVLGCGLLRTEFLFHDRATPPGFEEQVAAYTAIADQMGGKPITVRALDAGADKPIAFFGQPVEDNPALGERGIRLLLKNEAVFRDQLRAIIRTAQTAPVSLLIPMVNEASEMQCVRDLAQQETAILGVNEPLSIGAMIETPASILNAREIAGVSDFFSIGTNDLTQYILAMDRTHPSFARQSDGLSPAVVRALHMAGRTISDADRPIGVCGGLASDPLAIPILIACGVRHLSATLGDAAVIADVVRQLSIEICQNILAEALQRETATQVRDGIVAAVPALGLWR